MMRPLSRRMKMMKWTMTIHFNITIKSAMFLYFSFSIDLGCILIILKFRFFSCILLNTITWNRNIVSKQATNIQIDSHIGLCGFGWALPSYVKLNSLMDKKYYSNADHSVAFISGIEGVPIVSQYRKLFCPDVPLAAVQHHRIIKTNHIDS